MTTDDKLFAFENKALQRILGIKWRVRVSNITIREIPEVQPVNEFVRFSHWKWLGHVYRKQGIVRNIDGCVAPGRRSRGMSTETWKRTMRSKAGDECWGNLHNLAQDRAW